jgi:hypothetical protein
MTTSELIKQLQFADPFGSSEVIVDGTAIHFVAAYPGYYDGSYQVLERDPERTGRCYDVAAIRFTRAGTKVRLHLHSAEDAIMDCPDMPVILDDSLNERSKEALEQAIEDWRKAARETEA